ncbi:Helicase C-terminal [Trinorchestia longiramus]|nr:Helicase C-terminal [Trinorchestia longiramus]
MSSNNLFIHVAGFTPTFQGSSVSGTGGPSIVVRKKTKAPVGSFCVRRAGGESVPLARGKKITSRDKQKSNKVTFPSKTAVKNSTSNQAVLTKKVSFTLSSESTKKSHITSDLKTSTNSSNTTKSGDFQNVKPIFKRKGPHFPKNNGFQEKPLHFSENKKKDNSGTQQSSSDNTGLSSTEILDGTPRSPPPLATVPAVVGGSFGSGKQSGVVSSLFAGNPTIPSLPETDVEPIIEEVFSADNFASLEISPILVSHVAKLGYSSLTVVQQQGIPALLRGSDVLIKSQTGSGKTLTYALPIVNALLAKTPRVDRSDGVLALVVVPTRELALQTYRWLEDICRACVSIVPGYLIGGEKKKSEKNRLRRGVNILVATPGRLQDHISTTECLRLSNVRFFVLDEADRMLEMGYEKAIAGISEALSDARTHGDEKRFWSKYENAAAFDASRRKMADEGANDEDSVDKSKVREEWVSAKRKASDEVEEEKEDGEVQPFKKFCGEGGLVSTTIIAPSADKCGTPLQTIMLSATLNEHVQRLAGLSLRNPEVIDVSGDGSLDDLSAVTPGQLVHHYTLVPPKLRLVTLAAFILSKCLYGAQRKMLIFMATQDMVDYHTALLLRVLAKYGRVEKQAVEKSELETQADQVLDSFTSSKKKKPALVSAKEEQKEEVEEEPLIQFMQLRGNMTQAERTSVFNRFRTASSGVLLSTDVAARGLDLPSVSWIVQYTGAASVRDYVHRVGRTSRANTRGDALLVLAPSEAGYIEQLQNSKIALNEIKVEKILSAFTLRPPKMDPEFRLARSLQEGATNLQLQCEHLLLSSPDLLRSATRAYMSFIRAYASYPREVRDIFCYKALHLGHYAKSFALRDAPSSLHAHQTYQEQAAHQSKVEKSNYRQKEQFDKVLSQKRGAVPKMATISEFDSGLDDLAPRRPSGAGKKKPKAVDLAKPGGKKAGKSGGKKAGKSGGKKAGKSGGKKAGKSGGRKAGKLGVKTGKLGVKTGKLMGKSKPGKKKKKST